MRRLVREGVGEGQPITQWEIPMQVGISFQELDENLANAGAVEDVGTPLTYVFEDPVDSPEWLMKDLD